MGDKKEIKWKLPSLNIKENIAKLMSKWSVEFSVFLGLVFTLYDMDLVDIILIEVFLTIALIAFFIAVMIKFGIAVYKDSAKAIVESNQCIKDSKKCKTPENNVKEAVKTIEKNIPLIEPKKLPIDADYVLPSKAIDSSQTTTGEYLPGTEPD